MQKAAAGFRGSSLNAPHTSTSGFKPGAVELLDEFRVTKS
jgi:hypothetical protein